VPFTTVPKLTLDGVAKTVAGVTPVPLTGHCTLLFAALPVNKM